MLAFQGFSARGLSTVVNGDWKAGDIVRKEQGRVQPILLQFATQCASSTHSIIVNTLYGISASIFPAVYEFWGPKV